MGGGIVGGFGAIAGAGEEGTIRTEDHGPNRHLASGTGFSGFVQRDAHWVLGGGRHDGDGFLLAWCG